MDVFKHVPLYRFLAVCKDQSPGGRVLDCGAGGDQPPLSLFASHGFETKGIEFNEKAANKANQYGKDRNQVLNIVQGDMRTLDFPDASFDCVYSYNSVFHMMKVDVAKSVEELKRVLKPGGVLFVNFLSVDDFRCGQGPHLGDHQYEQMDDEPVIHSYYGHQEADTYFSQMEVLYKEVRVLERIYEGDRIRQGFVDYIVRK